MLDEVGQLRAALDNANRHNLAMQEMLAHAIDAMGEELRINKEDLSKGKFEGKRVSITEDEAAEQFVIRLVNVDE